VGPSIRWATPAALRCWSVASTAAAAFGAAERQGTIRRKRDTWHYRGDYGELVLTKFLTRNKIVVPALADWRLGWRPGGRATGGNGRTGLPAGAFVARSSHAGYDSSEALPSRQMDLPETLPVVFTSLQARRAGLTRHALYALRDRGEIECVMRGLYRRRGAKATDLDLEEIAARAPQATLCLTSALVRHGLTDEIPSSIDVAIPRGTRPHPTSMPVTWHRFDPKTFGLGRSELRLNEHARIGIYSPERCIIDAYRMSASEGPELGREALRRWLRRKGAQPATLLKLARSFPRTEQALRETLEILL